MTSDDVNQQRGHLERAIEIQEGLRGTLDDAIIDATVAALKKQLDELMPPEGIQQQRKLLTVLFMDVVDSTGLMAGMDPEENMAIMDGALRRLVTNRKKRPSRRAARWNSIPHRPVTALM